MDYKGIKQKTFLNNSSDNHIPVLFCAAKKDQNKYLEDISNQILKVRQDVVVHYADKQEDVTEELISHVKLVVSPITSDFLQPDCYARKHIFNYALEHNIPVLPFLKEEGIQSKFDSVVGDYHLFDDSTPETIENLLSENSRHKKLEKFLDKVLKEEALVERISKEFTGSMFLSYRKKDREYLDDVMSAVHLTRYTVDFSIWYDNYLVPGENYNDDIADKLRTSDIFVLLVTPHLLEEGNYVMVCEYPNAVKQGKIIVPIEAEETDFLELSKKYPGLSKPIPMNNREAISAVFDALADNLKLSENRALEHLYYIGMAALKGIGGELDYIKASTFFYNASIGGYDPATEMLIEMYSNPKYAINLVENAYDYQLERIDRFLEEHDSLSREEGLEYIRLLDKAIDLAVQMENYEEAACRASDAMNCMINISEQYRNESEDSVLLVKILKKYADCMLQLPERLEDAGRMYINAGNLCDISFKSQGYNKDADKIRMVAPLALLTGNEDWFFRGFDYAFEYQDSLENDSTENSYYYAYSVGMLMAEFCEFHIRKYEKYKEIGNESAKIIEDNEAAIKRYIRSLGEAGYYKLSYDLLVKYFSVYGAYYQTCGKLEAAKTMCLNAFRLYVSNGIYNDCKPQIANCNRLIEICTATTDFDIVYFVKECLYDIYSYLYEATDNYDYSDMAFKLEDELG